MVKTELMEVDLYSRLYSTGTSFVNLDRFDRVITNRWRRDLSTDRDVYHVALAYDRNSNITSQDDQVHAGHDVAYVNDGLNRLTQAEEGTWTGSAITSRTRDQQWTLSQTGNWELEKLDLDGDQNWNESGEHQDDRTHNAVNELTARDVDDDSTDDYSLTYDAAGNLTDDGEAYTYEWDAFYRLRRVRVRERETDDLVAEYWYDGLGYLLTRHQDTDTDGDVDGDDKKFHTAYDERWRPVATYRETDSEPKERFLYHSAGWGGFGTSSYIDLVVLRDRDANAGWTAASDGTLEERVYYAQNWRADVVALVKVGDQMQEWVKYSAYGVPFGIPGGDTDSDGDCDSTDVTQVQSWIDAPAYDVRGDIDLDGDVDATDKSTIQSSFQGTTLGRGALSATGVRNRKGYAGYEFDVAIGSKYHVRHRVLDSELGRWLARDPVADDSDSLLYAYISNLPGNAIDPTGLFGCYFPGPEHEGSGPGYCKAEVLGWGYQGWGGWRLGLFDGYTATPGDCVNGCKFGLHVGLQRNENGQWRMIGAGLDPDAMATAWRDDPDWRSWHPRAYDAKVIEQQTGSMPPGDPNDPDISWGGNAVNNDPGCQAASGGQAGDNAFCVTAPNGYSKSQVYGSFDVPCGSERDIELTAESSGPITYFGTPQSKGKAKLVFRTTLKCGKCQLTLPGSVTSSCPSGADTSISIGHVGTASGATNALGVL